MSPKTTRCTSGAAEEGAGEEDASQASGRCAAKAKAARGSKVGVGWGRDRAGEGRWVGPGDKGRKLGSWAGDFLETTHSN